MSSQQLDIPNAKSVPGSQKPKGALNIKDIISEVQDAYLGDNRPWVIGYSGGKDSTCTLQLVWMALSALPPEKLSKDVYVLSSDTLVETPAIVNFIDKNISKINVAANEQNLPIKAHIVTPIIDDSFWVNLIGKGYPAPSTRFRWCTERLKIDPANTFIKERVSEFGEVVTVLGVRYGESATRDQVMNLHKIENSRFAKHSTLKGALVYTPIQNFSVDNVWNFLLKHTNPWGSNNDDLLAMYRDAQAGECPLVIDKTTKSCGNSRFGCWVCTVVTKDKAMEAMIDNGQDWLEPLLVLRDRLAATQDPEAKKQVRDYRRRNGLIQFKNESDEFIRGPYTFDFRKTVLTELLEAEKEVNKNAPIGEKVTLIQVEELKEIRRIWRHEEGDWEDSVSTIVNAITGNTLKVEDDNITGFDKSDALLLKSICHEQDVPPQLVYRLLELETLSSAQITRRGIHKKIDRLLKQDWRTEADAKSARQMELTDQLSGKPQC